MVSYVKKEVCLLIHVLLLFAFVVIAVFYALTTINIK